MKIQKMELSSDLLEFIRLLNRNKVEYLVVGGWAVSLHGKPRYTKDIDILILPSKGNAVRMMQVIEEFGFGDLDIAQEDFEKPDFIIQLGMAPNRIDIITGLKGIDFSSAINQKIIVSYKEVPISIIGIDDLIRNKEQVARDQDLVDVKTLKRLKR